MLRVHFANKSVLWELKHMMYCWIFSILEHENCFKVILSAFWCISGHVRYSTTTCFIIMLYCWLNARLRYLHCSYNEDTAFERKLPMWYTMPWWIYILILLQSFHSCTAHLSQLISGIFFDGGWTFAFRWSLLADDLHSIVLFVSLQCFLGGPAILLPGVMTSLSPSSKINVSHSSIL